MPAPHPPRLGDGEGAGHVGDAGGPRQPRLLGRGSLPDEEIVRQRGLEPRQSARVRGQDQRLGEAALGEARRVERHRHHDVGLDAAERGHEELGERPGQLGPAGAPARAPLEATDRRGELAAVAPGRPHGLPRRRPEPAARADDRRARRQRADRAGGAERIERQRAAMAEAELGGQRVAGGAAGRKQKVEEHAQVSDGRGRSCALPSKHLRRLLLALTLVACSEPAPEDIGSTRQEIVGGVLDHWHQGVVGVGQRGTGPFCSGTIVSPRIILTAAHCGTSLADIDMVFVGDDLHFGGFVRVDQVIPHPSYFATATDDPFIAAHDLTLLRVTDDLPGQATPLLRETMTNGPDFVGPSFTFVGYGYTSGVLHAGFGVRRVATFPIDVVGPADVGGSLGNINETLFYFQLAGKNTCNGDSGGPALIARGGVERQAGLSSSGDQNCVFDGDEARADAPEVQAFIQPTIDLLSGGDPCRADGVCNESCNQHHLLVDPDCAEKHCALDGVCALACVAPLDPDCASIAVDRCGPDGVCNPSCAPLDPDCQALCGREGHCVTACDPPDPDCQGFCGDGIVQPGELCDDGNAVDGDGCDHDCKPSCGNGVVDPGEECDETSPTCRHCLRPFCGDGVVDPGEECDDGNNVNGDGCSKVCQSEDPSAPSSGCAVGGGPGGGGGAWLLALLLVIRLAAKDRVRPVDLLEEDDAREPVRQRDPAEGELPVGARFDLRRQPVGAADGEDQRRAAAVLLGGPDDLRRDLLAGEELAAGV